MESARLVKMEGKPNDLLDRIASDPLFGLSKSDLQNLLNVSDFVGRAPCQVREFIAEYIDPLLDRSAAFGKAGNYELTV